MNVTKLTRSIILLSLTCLASCSALNTEDDYTFVDFSQIANQPNKLNSQKIVIRGYLAKSIADEEQFILVPRIEDFQSEPFPPTRLFITAKHDITACFSEFVALSGYFRIDDYGIKWLDVEFAHAFLKVEPLATRSLVLTEQEKRDGMANCRG